MAGPLLSVEDVHTYYGEAHILQGVSIGVGDGEVVTLIGRNGAGKTTTLRSIMGIARPRRGAIRLAGEDLTRLPTHEIVRRGIRARDSAIGETDFGGFLLDPIFQ